MEDATLGANVKISEPGWSNTDRDTFTLLVESFDKILT